MLFNCHEKTINLCFTLFRTPLSIFLFPTIFLKIFSREGGKNILCTLVLIMWNFLQTFCVCFECNNYICSSHRSEPPLPQCQASETFHLNSLQCNTTVVLPYFVGFLHFQLILTTISVGKRKPKYLG